MFSDVMEATMKQPSVKFVILTGVTLKGHTKQKVKPSSGGDFCFVFFRVTPRQCLVGSFAGAAAS